MYSNVPYALTATAFPQFPAIITAGFGVLVKERNSFLSKLLVIYIRKYSHSLVDLISSSEHVFCNLCSEMYGGVRRLRLLSRWQRLWRNVRRSGEANVSRLRTWQINSSLPPPQQEHLNFKQTSDLSSLGAIWKICAVELFWAAVPGEWCAL